MAVDSSVLDEVRFLLVQPQEGDPTFSVEEPALLAEDLDFNHLVALLVTRNYLKKHGVCADDLTRRFNVDPESVNEYDDEPYPLMTWWESLLTMSRRDQSEEASRQEAEDWWRIVSTVLAFHTLHKHREGYNLPIPAMIDLYIYNACRQQVGDDVEVVHEDQLSEFIAWMGEYEVALATRVVTFCVEARVGTKGIPDYLQIMGNVAAVSNALVEAARGSE